MFDKNVNLSQIYTDTDTIGNTRIRRIPLTFGNGKIDSQRKIANITPYTTMKTQNLSLRIVLFYAILCIATSYSFGQGIFLRAAGAVNESMGGAGTAAPLDGMGALQWNPAGISMLENNEVSFGMGLVLPSCSMTLASPWGSDTADGEPGAVPTPSAAMIYRPNPCSRWTYGFAMNAFGGAKLAYSYLGELEAPTPIGPQSPLAGLGTLNSDIYLLQMLPTASYKISDNLSVGGGVNVCMAQVLCDPLFVSATPEGYVSPYPSGTSSRYAWGAGFQLGVYYRPNDCWSFGFMYKSPTWMEPFRYHTIEVKEDGTKEAGLRKLHLNVPEVMSFGIAYTGFNKTLIAIDFRRFGFNDAGGDYVKMGWKNLFGLNIGIQREINERLTLRCGYAYNDCPYESPYALANSATPLITQHVLFMGGTMKITPQVELTLAYSHAFKNSVTGPIGNTVLTTSSEIGANAITGGVRVLF